MNIGNGWVNYWSIIIKLLLFMDTNTGGNQKMVIKSRQIDAIKKKIGKAYFCSCFKCNRLHIWSQKSVKGSNKQYYCSGCRTLNDILEEDLI